MLSVFLKRNQWCNSNVYFNKKLVKEIQPAYTIQCIDSNMNRRSIEWISINGVLKKANGMLQRSLQNTKRYSVGSYELN